MSVERWAVRPGLRLTRHGVVSEGVRDLLADGHGGRGRAVETAVQEHQSVDSYSEGRALSVEVDEATRAEAGRTNGRTLPGGLLRRELRP
ncbi:hypothetical protein ADK70_36975 [Streptomyces rimosus subsp. pseudoverticillatus]|nr:hypothetical protein ADK70_36975 [Streptomyces rimosus subsp. pseudoverticillatus]